MSALEDIIRCLEQLVEIRRKWGLPPLPPVDLTQRCPVCGRKRIFIGLMCDDCADEYYDE